MGYYSTYYSYGLPTFLVIFIALYLLFTGTCSNTKNPQFLTLHQTPERRSTLVAFLKNQAHMRGALLELVFASV